MQFGMVSVLCCVTVCILVLVLSVLRSAVLCLWKEQTDSAVWHGYSAVLCDSLYIFPVCYVQPCCVDGRKSNLVMLF